MKIDYNGHNYYKIFGRFWVQKDPGLGGFKREHNTLTTSEVFGFVVLFSIVFIPTAYAIGCALAGRIG